MGFGREAATRSRACGIVEFTNEDPANSTNNTGMQGQINGGFKPDFRTNLISILALWPIRFTIFRLKL